MSKKSRVIQSFIFDLDGTLIDSYPGIRDSLAFAVRFSGLKLPFKDLRKKIGPPISKMIYALWPKIDQESSKKILKRFRYHYNRKGCLRSRIYPGVRQILEGIKRSKKKAFLLTNKPAKPTSKILRHLKIEDFFVEVVCPDSQYPTLGAKKEGALLLKRKHRLFSTETLLVGDSQDDWHAATTAGFRFGIALYGYGRMLRDPARRACFVLKSPRDFSRILY